MTQRIVKGLASNKVQLHFTRRTTCTFALIPWRTLPGPLPISWRKAWHPEFSSAVVVLHALSLPVTPLSQRVIAGLGDAQVAIIRELGLTGAADGLDVSTRDGVQVRPTAPDRFGPVIMNRFEGSRVSEAGQISIAFSLPRDNMGSMLDERSLVEDLVKGLGFVAALILKTQLGSSGEVAVAAELDSTTLLTDGDIGSLGHQSQATMGLGDPVAQLPAEEAVPLWALVDEPARGRRDYFQDPDREGPAVSWDLLRVRPVGQGLPPGRR